MTFVAVVSLTGVLQGLVLLVALRRIEQSHRVANKVLSVFVGLVVVTLAVRIIRDEGHAIRAFYPQVLLLMDTPVYAYGPLLFLYLTTLARPDGKLPRMWGLHFIPVALHLLRQTEYYLEGPAEFATRLQSGNFPFWQYVLMGAVVQMGVYVAVCTIRVFGHRSHTDADRLAHASYVKTFLVLITLAWAAWGYHALSVFTGWVPKVGYVVVDLAWVMMSLIPVALAYFAIGRQEVFRLGRIIRRYEGSLLSDADVDALQDRLVAVMASDKPYLQPGLTLQELAEAIDCAPKELSRVINERFGQNFFDFVNGYRVAEFRRLAQEDAYRHHTVLAIAYEAGFNSKSTFYAAFRKTSAEAPADFLRSVQGAVRA